MIDACLIVAGSFQATCQDALGLRAGATIAVLGGRCAERTASMATTEVRVDVGALAAALRGEVSDRLATTLIVGFENCEEDGRELNQLQKTMLTKHDLNVFDGIERDFARIIVRDLTWKGIAVWGLPDRLADLLPREGDDA
jgi:hypothetical protein